QHRSDALDAFDHAGCDRRQHQFCRVEGISSTGRIGIKMDLRGLCRGDGPVGIHPAGFDLVFEHQATSFPSTISTTRALMLTCSKTMVENVDLNHEMAHAGACLATLLPCSAEHHCANPEISSP